MEIEPIQVEQHEPQTFSKKKLLFIALAGIFLIGALWEITLSHTSFTGLKIITINPLLGSRNIGDLLKREGVINSKWAFVLYVKLLNKSSQLKAGDYTFSDTASIQEITSTLIRGEPEMTIVIPEGWSAFDIADELKDQKLLSEEFLKLINTHPSLALVQKYTFLADIPKSEGIEGYLFPDTYFIRKGKAAEHIIEKTLANFDEKFTQDLRAEAAKQKKKIYDIVTVASLVEKEVVSEEDRAIVAGIIWKRLAAGIPLQIDASIVYIKRQIGKETVGNKISSEDIKINSPYNTYKYPGLPVGPIGNPGISAIKATMYFKTSPYLYYLSKPDGTTVFSRTLEEHNAAKAKYLK